MTVTVNRTRTRTDNTVKFSRTDRRQQCCQMVFVKMRKKIVKMREKMRQPKMSKFLLHFWTFQRGYKSRSSKIFFKIAKN